MRKASRIAVTLPDGRVVKLRLWPGRGAPLVLLHGLLDSSHGWDDLAKASHRPCYAVDLPGFGGSDCPVQATIDAYADDVIAALDQLHLDAFTLVGHSLGGAVATAVAERVGHERCPALVLMAPAGFGRQPIAEAVCLPGVHKTVRAALPFCLANPLVMSGAYALMVSHRKLPSRKLLGRLARHCRDNVAGTSMAARAIAAAGHDPRAFFRRRVDYQGAVTALWGRHDKLIPLADAERLKRALPQAKITVWEDVAHHPQREVPVQLARCIERACARARAARMRARRAQHRHRAAQTASLAAAA